MEKPPTKVEHAFDADADDHCETSPEAHANIINFLAKAAEAAERRPKISSSTTRTTAPAARGRGGGGGTRTYHTRDHSTPFIWSPHRLWNRPPPPLTLPVSVSRKPLSSANDVTYTRHVPRVYHGLSLVVNTRT